CDQHAAAVIARAHEQGLGVIAKRPLANAPWRFADRPVGHEAEFYWVRWKALAFDPGELAWDELAARFAAHSPGISAAITGTRQIAHLRHNAALVARGALPDPVGAAVRARFQAVGADWPARI
ncbi:MAG TPA: aldo/keto reductase, partial [Kofleriaceae bacterium]|nr:aldo/keto reductase [Kofleriaceae bacterium]